MKKINNLLVLVDTINKYEFLKSLNIKAFLFPLQNFAIGYNTFSLEDIPLGDNNYLLINRLLDCKDIDNLEKLIKDLKNIKGIVFEDIGVFEILKDSSLELIWFQNHYGTNSEIVNYYNDLGLNSCVLSYDITKKELETICNNCKKEVVVKIFGYNQIMYSRRELLSNYQAYFNLKSSKKENLTEEINGQEFIIKENEYGTVILNKNIFDGRCLLDLPNIKYFLVDTCDIDENKIKEFIDNLDNLDYSLGEDFDEGFLYTETIYKIKEEGAV